MRLNSWQLLGVVLLIVGLVWILWDRRAPEPQMSEPPAATQPR
jgi:hypothetical protein